MVGIPTEAAASSINQTHLHKEMSKGSREMAFDYRLSQLPPDEIKQLHRQYLLDFVSRRGNPKNAASVSPVEAVISTATAIGSDKEMTRRDFLKTTAAAAASAALPQLSTNESGPQMPIDNESAVFAAKGMAWNLLMQVKARFGDKLADLNADAYYHAANVVLEQKGDYKQAQEIFERIADSLLKLGATEALNKIRAGKNVAYRLDDIRDIINDNILNHNQKIDKFYELFTTSKKELTENEWVQGKKGDSGYFPDSYVWRTMIGKDGAYVRNAPAKRDASRIDNKVEGDEITFAYSIDTDKFAKSDVIPHHWLVARRDDLRLPIELPFTSLFWDDKTKADALAKTRSELSFVARTASTNVTYP